MPRDLVLEEIAMNDSEIPELLTRFYTAYNTEKLDRIPSLLKKYKGREEILFAKLENKYKAEHFFANIVAAAVDPAADPNDATTTALNVRNTVSADVLCGKKAGFFFDSTSGTSLEGIEKESKETETSSLADAWSFCSPFAKYAGKQTPFNDIKEFTRDVDREEEEGVGTTRLTYDEKEGEGEGEGEETVAPTTNNTLPVIVEYLLRHNCIWSVVTDGERQWIELACRLQQRSGGRHSTFGTTSQCSQYSGPWDNTGPFHFGR